MESSVMYSHLQKQDSQGFYSPESREGKSVICSLWLEEHLSSSCCCRSPCWPGSLAPLSSTYQKLNFELPRFAGFSFWCSSFLSQSDSPVTSFRWPNLSPNLTILFTQRHFKLPSPPFWATVISSERWQKPK